MDIATDTLIELLEQRDEALQAAAESKSRE
jgi:hypothetical protein